MNFEEIFPTKLSCLTPASLSSVPNGWSVIGLPIEIPGAFLPFPRLYPIPLGMVPPFFGLWISAKPLMVPLTRQKVD
jgi:hypothetical protein